MRRTSLVASVLLWPLFVACGEEAPVEPATVETCEELETLTVQVMQSWVDIADQIPFDELSVVSFRNQAGEEFLMSSTERSEAIQDRWSELGCRPDLDDLIPELSEGLTAETRSGEYAIETFKGGPPLPAEPVPSE